MIWHVTKLDIKRVVPVCRLTGELLEREKRTPVGNDRSDHLALRSLNDYFASVAKRNKNMKCVFWLAAGEVVTLNGDG